MSIVLLSISWGFLFYRLINISEFNAIQETGSTAGVETYLDMVFVIGDIVLLPQCMEVTAFPAGRKAFFQYGSVYGDTECVFAVLLLTAAIQQVGCGGVLAENVRKEKFYLVDSFRSVEAISFDVGSEGLEQGAVGGVPYLGLRALFFTADESPAAFFIRLVGEPGQLALVGGVEALASYVDRQFQIFQVGSAVQICRNGGEVYFQAILYRLSLVAALCEEERFFTVEWNFESRSLVFNTAVP